jgi:hypothetical protein
VEYLWKPHPGPQTEFCSRGEFEVLYGGAAGPGKTDCLIIEATRFVHNTNYRALLIRRTFPQLQEIIDRCREYYPTLGGVYRATEHRWYFPSGSFIRLGHMQHETDKYDYQGHEYQYIGFDEATQFSGDQYLYLFSRCRSTDQDIPARIRSATNPGGIGHRFFKERFVDVGPEQTTYIDPVTGLSRAFIPGRLSDNPTLIDNDPGYIQRLRALPQIERMRLEEGIWDIFEGQVFTELSQRVHGCEPFPVPPEWEKFVAFDWGYARPFSVGWYAIDFDGIIYRYREWYGSKEGQESLGLRMTAIEVARGIMEREKEKVRYRVADPACWNQTIKKDKTIGPSVIEDMSKEGLQFIKADNNRMLGKLQVHQRLRVEEEKDQEGNITSEHPQVVIFNNCKHFWTTMESLREDPRNPEDVDTDQNDHVYDEFRYALMSRPIISKHKAPGPPPGSFAAERSRLIRAKKYAQKYGVSLAAAYQRIR